VLFTTATLAFSSASVSAEDPDLSITPLQKQRKSTDSQAEALLENSIGSVRIWDEEDGLIEKKENEVPGFTEGDDGEFHLQAGDIEALPFSPEEEEDMQVLRDSGEDGDAMFLQASSDMQKMINLINNERRSRGISTLCFNSKLNQAALAHSIDMRDRVFFSHTGSDGSSFSTRVRRAGYENFRRGAENIATYGSIEAAHRALMNSPGHKRNILGSGYKNIGIGITKYTSGRYRGNYVITQVFATSSSEGCSNGSCSDSPRGWYDSDGPEYNCGWYARGNNCQDYGDGYSNFGKTAKQACCSCGGGSRS